MILGSAAPVESIGRRDSLAEQVYADLLGKLRETKSNFEFLVQVQKTTPVAVGGSSDDEEL